jgi:site-specific recombinase XerD
MSKLQKLKTQFLEYLEIEKHRSLLTIRNYDLYLSRFINFAKGRGISAPEKIDLDLVRNFRLRLNRQRDRHGHELKAVTQNYHMIALRSFLKYLARRDIKTLNAEKSNWAKRPNGKWNFWKAMIWKNC